MTACVNCGNPAAHLWSFDPDFPPLNVCNPCLLTVVVNPGLFVETGRRKAAL